MTTELAPPKGHGIVRVAHNLRTVAGPRSWADIPATDYWWMAGSADSGTASGATNISGLDSYGWTTTSLGSYTNLVTGDFMSSSDDTPPHQLANASGDLLGSPKVFGSYSHQLAVGQTLGQLPTRLMCEFYGAFTVDSANESATNMGFHNGSALVASIYSDATNFQLSNGATTDAGAATDNAFHQFKIQVNSADSLITWWIDGTSQGTLAVTQDVWPVSFIAVASTTNRWGLSWVRCWYEC
jgi:hypothetical protein